MNYGIEMVQINDALNETSACSSSAVYDKKNGLVFVSYMTGVRKHYGEAAGRICLAVFSPSQPENIRRRIIDYGIGASRGVLCNAIYLVGDGVVRLMFTATRGELGVFYRDYDFLSDTISERVRVVLVTDEGDVCLTKESYKDYLATRGLNLKAPYDPIINKVTKYKDEFYTAISVDSLGYPTLCKIDGNRLVPFAICPEAQTYEFRYFINDDGIFAAYRIPPDDHKTRHAAFTVSRDGGKSWETKIYEDGIQSRPDIIDYYGKPLYVYNYKSDKSVENFPDMHNFRNAIKIIYDGEIVFDWFTKYGIVEYDLVNIRGDIYMAFSNCPQALSIENGVYWVEDGIPVEQGKEAIQWAKIGYLGKRADK